MKTSLVIVLAGAVVLVTGLIVHSKRQAAQTSPAPAAELAPANITTQAAEEPEPEGAQPKPPPHVNEPPPVLAETALPSHPEPTSAAPSPTPFSQAIDVLVSTQASFQQKEAALAGLRNAGQLDQAIEALKRGAVENPNAPAYPAALGQAQLQKADVLARSGGKISEMGVLGLEADQNFDSALKLDPTNWEAQFFKAAAMSHWPAELKKGDEVLQRLSRLIDQQETMPQQPQFAQTYVLLGEQYLKAGKPDYAAATWQIGAQKFPNNPTLQQKLGN